MVTNPWAAFLLRRLIGLACVVIVLVVAVFLIVRLVPGDPISRAVGPDVPPAQVAQIRKQAGLDRPLHEQFTSYVTGLLHGDLGEDYITQQPVSQIISQRVRTSLELALAALAIVLAFSIPIGMSAAALTRDGRRRGLELGFTTITSALSAVPDYLTGTVLAFLFAVQFQLLPVAGAGSLDTLILPALAVSLSPVAALARIVRVETLTVLSQDYIRTARSKRLPGRVILFRHALPNVATAALTIGGLVFAGIIGGAVVVENVFNRPGLGSALVQAVINRQYPTVQGITLVLGLAVVVINTAVDILLGLIDPRSLTRES